MEQDIRNKLFALIRRGMGVGDDAVDCTAEEYTALFRIGERQGIVPILFSGLDRETAFSEAAQPFYLAYLKDVAQVVKTVNALVRVSIALVEDGIPYIPLKGAVLRNIYPNPMLRTSCDLDVLVHEEDLDRAVKAIEEKTEFRAGNRNYHDVSMTDAAVHLELHFSIKENMENIDRLLVRVWDYASPAGECCWHVLTPEYLVFHTIAHMSYHMVHGGLGIRPFLDLWLLRNRTEFDEGALRRMCEECGILVFYEKSSALVDAWMSGAPVPEDLAALEQYALEGRVFGTQVNAVASSMRNRSQAGYVLSRLFLSREVLESEYPELKDRPYLMPVCQVKRWTRLANPQKRKHARRELEKVKNISAETVDAFAGLLDSLGL